MGNGRYRVSAGAALALLLCLLALRAGGGERTTIFFPDLLPANTIFCMVPPDGASLERDFSQTLFSRFAAMPEMGPFLRSFDESRKLFADDVSKTANVPPQLATDLVTGRLGLALLNVGIGRDGTPAAEYVIAISLRSSPDRNTVFSAVMSLLNRPEVIRAVLKSQGIDPNIPLRTLAQEESVAGGPPILRIGPNIRVAAVGNLVLIYNGPGSDGIRKIFEAMSNPAASLTRSGAFQAAYRGAEAKPGSSFLYLNVPRAIALLDTLNLGRHSGIAEALGLGTVQSMGVTGAYHMEGVRHSMYLHIPGGNFSGLMATLLPMPADAPVGIEGYAQTIPSPARSFLAARVDVRSLLREIPYILDTMGALTQPGGVTSLVQNERILGVTLPELLRPVGGDVIIRPHEDSQVLIFQNVDIAGFENVIARMEQNAGARFSSQTVNGYQVRYFNRRSSLTMPMAPAFCLVPRQPGSPTGILYMASHPQAVSSLIMELLSANEPLSGIPDFRKTASGLAGNYSLYYYNGNTDCYRRFYNFLLPVLSLWSSSARYHVDTGLLPVASKIAPAMFGSGVGIRCLPEGMQIHAFSPVGLGAIIVQLTDKLIVSNPLVIGYTYAALEEWMRTLPAIAW